MAARTGIWNLVLIGHLGGNEIERVAADVDVRDCLLNLRHVAGHAIASSASVLMMSVRFDRRCVRTVRRRRSMTVETKLSGGLNQIRIVCRPMNIVTTEASNAASVHKTLHKIVTLHPILMTGAFREVCERRLA